MAICCDPCVLVRHRRIQYARPQDYYTHVATLLCDIRDAIAEIPGAGTPSEWVSVFGSETFDNLDNNFRLVLNDAQAKVEILVNNQSDQPIEVSFDGVTVAGRIGEWSAQTWRPGQYNRKISTGVYARYEADLGSRGLVIVSGGV